MDALVSVVVPVYNVQFFLKDCVDSLIKQTYSPIEIILVDDGSDDGSDLICDSYSNDYSNIFTFHLTNSGVSFARNYGLEKSSGQYVLFADSDDVADSTMIEKMVSALENTDSDASICGIELFNTNYFKARRQRKVSLIHDRVITISELKEYASVSPLNPYYGAPYNKLLKKDLLMDNNIRFLSDVPLAEDASFNYSFFHVCTKIAILDDILFFHRLNSGKSLSRRKHTSADINRRLNELRNTTSLFLGECDKKIYGKYMSELLGFQIRLLANCSDLSFCEKSAAIKYEMSQNCYRYYGPYATLIAERRYLLFVVLYYAQNKLKELLKFIFFKVNKILKLL